MYTNPMDALWGDVDDVRAILIRLGAIDSLPPSSNVGQILNHVAGAVAKDRSNKAYARQHILDGLLGVLDFGLDSIRTVSEELLQHYSVYDTNAISAFYDAVVEQYLLDRPVISRLITDITTLPLSSLLISEDGPGTGVFPMRLINELKRLSKPFSYDIIEPNVTFRSLIRARNLPVTIFDATGESWRAPNSCNVKVVRYTSHHYPNKPLALQNHFINLQPGGFLFIPEVCFSEYAYREDFRPTHKDEFVRSVARYAPALIASMPDPSLEVIIDQVITAYLDILRVEELKTCRSILITLIEEAGFKILANDNLSTDPDIIWAYIVAQKQ